MVKIYNWKGVQYKYEIIYIFKAKLFLKSKKCKSCIKHIILHAFRKYTFLISDFNVHCTIPSRYMITKNHYINEIAYQLIEVFETNDDAIITNLNINCCLDFYYLAYIYSIIEK